MKVVIGPRTYELPSSQLIELRDCNAVLSDRDALNERLEEDGYLLVRGMHDRDRVMSARRIVCEALQAEGKLAPGTDPMDAVIADGAKGAFWGGRKGVTHHDDMIALLEDPQLMGFFSFLFDQPTRTFDYKWLRTVATGDFTGAHYDVVYMGRGSGRLHTTWTPLGDTPTEHGSLVLCLGSHREAGFQKVRDTYGRMDVDRDHVQGNFEDDADVILERFGGKLGTADFRAGDVLIFGMYTMHMSTTNLTDRFRLSTDTRFQPASDPIDERWVGANPIAHYGWNAGDRNVAMADARARWGV